MTQLQRTAVIGATGSGKTTFARTMATILNVPFIELDALYWQANWQPVEPEVFRARVSAATATELWVSAGNYSKVRDIVWSRATHVVWLDYPFPIVAYQLLRRTISRIVTQEEMWGGNKETFLKAFFRKDSIILWLLQTYWRNRHEFPRQFRLPEYAHLNITHLSSRRASRDWLDGLLSL